MGDVDNMAYLWRSGGETEAEWAMAVGGDAGNGDGANAAPLGVRLRVRDAIIRIERWIEEEGRAGAGYEGGWERGRSEEHTSELQSLMRISYAVFCLKKKQRMDNDVIMHVE